jgi:hypothetical protein
LRAAPVAKELAGQSSDDSHPGDSGELTQGTMTIDTECQKGINPKLSELRRLAQDHPWQGGQD